MLALGGGEKLSMQEQQERERQEAQKAAEEKKQKQKSQGNTKQVVSDDIGLSEPDIFASDGRDEFLSGDINGSDGFVPSSTKS